MMSTLCNLSMPTLGALSHYKVSGQFGVWLCSLLWLLFGTSCHPASIPSNIYSMHASFIQHLYHKYLVATESSQNAEEGFVCSSSWVALLEHFSGGVSASLKMSPSWLSYLRAAYIEVSEINTDSNYCLPVNWLARWLQDTVNTLGMLKCTFSSNDFK